MFTSVPGITKIRAKQPALLRRSLLAAAVAAMMVPVVPPAFGQIALYADRLPDGFAYVRFVNTTPDALTIRTNFGDALSTGADAATRLTPYQVVEKVAERALTADVASGGANGHLTLQLKPGSFHTVLVARKGTEVTSQVIVDASEYNQLRARLAFYNATADCPNAALALEPSNQSVFSGVAPGAMRARSVNPVAAAKVRATCGTAKPPVLDLGELGAGGLYSVWLMAPDGNPSVFLARDTIAPYLR